MKLSVLSLLALPFCLSNSAGAQSLKPESPAPLQAGINKGTVDSLIGSHYWFFTGGPGASTVHVKFKAMGLLGAAYKSTITVTLSDQKNTWHTTKPLTSTSQADETSFAGNAKTPIKILVTVAPPLNNLVRSGGDYEITATGAVAFAPKSNADPVIGAYKQMSGYTSNLGICKFLPDGRIETTSGGTGTWKLFDQSSSSYVVNIDGQERKACQFRAGRGLCDGDAIVFQELR